MLYKVQLLIKVLFPFYSILVMKIKHWSFALLHALENVIFYHDQTLCLL